MLIIKKKKIVFLLSCTLLPIFLYPLLFYTIPTNTSNSSTIVISLDAGHGLPDTGAIGIDGTSEEAINLNIVFKIQKLLEQSRI